MTVWTTWLPWLVVALILVSVLYELATGRARVRGLGSYTRAEQPGRFWASVVLKAALCGFIAVLATQGFWH